MGFKYGISLDFAEVVTLYRPGVEVCAWCAEPLVVDERVTTVFVAFYAFHSSTFYFLLIPRTPGSTDWLVDRSSGG